MTIRPLIWATTSNPLAHTEAHTLLYALLVHKHLFSACCVPCTVLDWGAQANLGELTHCSGPQVTSCPGVTCHCWEAVTPTDCHIPWGSHSPRQSPHWFFGFHNQPLLVDRLHYYPPPLFLPARPLAHKPGGTCHGHTRAPVHLSCCRTAPQAHSHSQTCRALLGRGLRPGASAGSPEVRAPGPTSTEPVG